MVSILKRLNQAMTSFFQKWEAKNDLAVLVWHGFCVMSLRDWIPFFLVNASSEGTSIILDASMYLVGALWYSVVAMGLPSSMIAVPLICFLDSEMKQSLLLARVVGLLGIQVGTWAYLKNIGQDIPQIMVVVGFIEDIPESWWTVAYKMFWAASPFIVLSILIQVYKRYRGVRNPQEDR